jgi:micrococcal nuclease
VETPVNAFYLCNHNSLLAKSIPWERGSTMRTAGRAAALVPLFLCVTALGVDAFAAPSCLPPIEIAHAKVVRVARSGVLVLADGRAARLEGVILPAGSADHAPDFYADAAIDTLSTLVVGRTIAFAAAPPKQDRYGRLRAQVILSNEPGKPWLQAQILDRGLARVSIAPDRLDCVAELYAAETRARDSKTGIWNATAYRVRAPADLAGDIGTFQLVEGFVTRVSQSGGRVFLDFRPGRNFAATISSDDVRNFRRIGVDAMGYSGRTVRVRGWIEKVRRPEIEIAVPQDVEVLDTRAFRGTLAPE